MAEGQKRMKIVLASLSTQGCIIERKSKGWLVKFPDGGSMTVHNTNSDHRAELNIRSRVLRAGLAWPFDNGHRKRG